MRHARKRWEMSTSAQMWSANLKGKERWRDIRADVVKIFGLGLNKLGEERTYVQGTSGAVWYKHSSKGFGFQARRGIWLTDWGTIRFSRRNLLRGVKIITPAKTLFYFNLTACQIIKFRISQPLLL